MSFKAAAWAIEQRITSTPAQKLVLAVLADAYNGKTGRCDPSIQTIADRCHMSYRTVTRALSDLEKLGLIRRENHTDSNRLKTPNSYKLSIGQDVPSIGQGVPSIGHGDRLDGSNTTPTDGSNCPINQEEDNQEEENQEYSVEVQEVLSHLNEVTGSKYQPAKTSLQNINARIKQGYTPDELRAVIDFKHREWAGTKYAQYLRPQTLFAPTKFPGYLAAASAAAQPWSNTTAQNIANLRDWANGTH